MIHNPSLHSCGKENRSWADMIFQERKGGKIREIIPESFHVDSGDYD
jgi:hypothetical protein